MWDLKYKELVIDPSKIDGITLENGTKISKDSTVEVIKTNADEIRDYTAKNYILGFNANFTISKDNEAKEEESFDSNGEFQKSASVTLKSTIKENISEKNDEKDSNDGILKNNNSVFKIHFVVQPTENKVISFSLNNDSAKGIYKGFYLIGYKNNRKTKLIFKTH